MVASLGWVRRVLGWDEAVGAMLLDWLGRGESSVGRAQVPLQLPPCFNYNEPREDNMLEHRSEGGRPGGFDSSFSYASLSTA